MTTGRFFVGLASLVVVEEKARALRRREQGDRFAPGHLVASLAQLTAMKRCEVGKVRICDGSLATPHLSVARMLREGDEAADQP